MELPSAVCEVRREPTEQLEAIINNAKKLLESYGKTTAAEMVAGTGNSVKVPAAVREAILAAAHHASLVRPDAQLAFLHGDVEADRRDDSRQRPDPRQELGDLVVRSENGEIVGTVQSGNSGWLVHAPRASARAIAISSRVLIVV